MDIFSVLELLSGVALFLFGMGIMGDGLKRVAGDKLEMILYKLSSTPLKGILLGTGVTAVIQSSSATSVMVVGFVNSEMMQVKQAIGIIMGAIIGTSVTGWILCLSSIGGGEASGWIQLLSTSTLTAVVAIIGILFKMGSKKAAKKHLGDILLGFSVLMLGMHTMSASVAPLRESPAFMNAMTKFSNPFLGIFFGMAITCVLQSASATVGILQALAMTGAINFAVALPIIMGIAVGASLPVLMSAIGSSTNGKRTAFVYLLIDALGVIIWGIVFYSANAAVHFSFMGMTMTTVSIALVNTIFRVLTVIVLYPFIGLLERCVCTLFKETKDKEIAELDCLQESLIHHPAIALEQSRKILYSMGRKANKNLLRSLEVVKDYSDEKFEVIEKKENIIDQYEDTLGSYVVKVARNELTPIQQKDVARILHTVSDLERISDHAMNIANTAKQLKEKKVEFSVTAQKELTIIENAMAAVVGRTVNILGQEGDGVNLDEAYSIEPLEQLIDDYCAEAKAHHVTRMQEGFCSYNQGFMFNDLLTDYERVADHCSNVAAAFIEIAQGTFNPHNYVLNIRVEQSERFDEEYKNFQRRFGKI